MLTPRLLNALAQALVSGDADRVTRVVGHRWRWIMRPLVVRYQKMFAGKPRPRLAEVYKFLEDDERLQRHRKTLKLAQTIPDSPTMQPVAAARGWNLPPIETERALAQFLDISDSHLEWFADLGTFGARHGSNPRLRHYSYRVLQKDANHFRLIEAPKTRLKQIQRLILTRILDLVPPHETVHGFRAGRSIQTFCVPHVSKQVVLKMDLQDFFPSISRVRVQSLFRTFGYPERVADLLGGLCTTITPSDAMPRTAWAARQIYRQPHLPQGAPTSPALANLCAYHLDCRLNGLAVACGATYTRYADDLAFSGDAEFAKRAERFSTHVAAIVAREGFAVHHRKTRIMRASVRQHIAGLVINQRLNVRRTDFDELKAILTNCVRSGPASQNRENHDDFRAHLVGRVGFIQSIHPIKGAKLEMLLKRVNW